MKFLVSLPLTTTQPVKTSHPEPLRRRRRRGQGARKGRDATYPSVAAPDLAAARFSSMEASSSSCAAAAPPPPSIPSSSDQGVWADASPLLAAACRGKTRDRAFPLLFADVKRASLCCLEALHAGSVVRWIVRVDLCVCGYW